MNPGHFRNSRHHPPPPMPPRFPGMPPFPHYPLPPIPDTSSQLRALGTRIDDLIIKMATDSGIPPDLLRRYYVNQCTTVSRPSSFSDGREESAGGPGPSPHPVRQPAPLGPPKSKHGSKKPLPPPGYSCDIEAALFGAISDEDQDVEEQKGGSIAPEYLDIDLDFFQRPEDSPLKLRRPVKGKSSQSSDEDFGFAKEYAHQMELSLGPKEVKISYIVERKNIFFVRMTQTKLFFHGIKGMDLPPLNIKQGKIGMPCVARCLKLPDMEPSADSEWRRGRIERMNRNTGSVTVFLVDSGILQEYRMPKDVDYVRCLSPLYATAPLAFRCSLSPSLKKNQGYDSMKIGQVYVAEFSPAHKGKGSFWEATEMTLQTTEETTDVDALAESLSKDASLESVPAFPEAKRLQIGEWVKNLDHDLDVAPAEKSQTSQPPPRASTSTSTGKESWD